jgi:hypothetical protein
VTKTEFVLEFDRLSSDVDQGPKSITLCRDVEEVTLECWLDTDTLMVNGRPVRQS